MWETISPGGGRKIPVTAVSTCSFVTRKTCGKRWKTIGAGLTLPRGSDTGEKRGKGCREDGSGGPGTTSGGTAGTSQGSQRPRETVQKDLLLGRRDFDGQVHGHIGVKSDLHDVRPHGLDRLVDVHRLAVDHHATTDTLDLV